MVRGLTRDVVAPHNGARAVPAGLHTWGGGREAGASWETWAELAAPNVSTHPTPAIPQPRGVEDAAPYGRQRDGGIRIVVNRCASAASLIPPLGSPERGAVAALCAVTEGLAQRGWGVPTLSVNQRRAGVEARPYEAWGGGCDKPEYPVDQRTAHRGRCALRRVGNVSALQMRHPSTNGRGVEDAAPYGGCVWLHFSGAVRYSLSHQLRCMPQGRFRCCM